jgi:hypothetical protein
MPAVDAKRARGPGKEEKLMGKTTNTAFATGLAVTAIITAGLGCGPREASDTAATTPADSETAPDRELPQPGEVDVEYSNGLATVRSNGALRLAVLEQLAAQAGFEITAEKIDAQPITLQIERVSLIEAIASILEGLAYTLEYKFDEASKTRMIARIKIGDTLEDSAANVAEQAPTDEPRMRDRAPSIATRTAEGARSDRMEPAREARTAEQAELLSELDNPDPEARAEAAEWIDLDGEALERLISLLESDPDAEVRAAIVDRLGDEGSPAAMAALVVALRDPDPEVVMLAIETLEFEGGDWLIPELTPLLAHSDPDVRDTAGDAIEFLK